MSPTIGERLRTARVKAGLTQEALAEKIGVGPLAVSRWETGKATPPATRMPAIARSLGITLEALEGGGEMAVAEGPTPYAEGDTRLPVYGMGHIAGTTDAEPEIVERLPVGERERALADALIRIHGSSMEPAFVSGDLVGIKLQSGALPDQVVLAMADGELTFKVWGGEVAGKGLLLPLNPEHKRIIADEVRILGVYRFLKRDSKDGRA